MKPTARTFKTRFRVRYAETDQMGVVYHANYLVWFEVGRVELMRELGFAYQQLEAEQDCVLPVVELSCRYRSPARYDEELELETRLIALRGPVLKFAYQLRRPQPLPGPGPEPGPGDKLAGEPAGRPASTLLAEAITTHVVVDRTLRKRNLPESYAAALLACLC